MPGLDPVSMGISALGSIGKTIFGFVQNHKANQMNPVYTPYETSPYAQQQLGIAQQMFNGRMPGAGMQEQNIAGSQANYMSNAGRNATDSGQLLALGGLAQGQSNNAYQQQAMQEAQNKQRMLGNLNQAYGGMINEGDKVFQDKWNKFQMDTGIQAATRQAAWQNIFGGVGDLGSMATMMGGGGGAGMSQMTPAQMYAMRGM